MLDVYADTPEFMCERIDFVSDVFGGPFSVDSTDALVRVAGLNHAEEVGLVDRLVYNSINVGTGVEELRVLAESSLSSAILLAFNPLSNTLEGKMRVLDEGGGLLGKGLLETAVDCGIKKPLVDTGITPLGEGASSAVRAIPCVKARYGLPAGCGVHNAVLAWRWPKKDEKLFADAASNALARIAGADFILYGPIERARNVFSTVAFAECVLGEVAEEFGLDVGSTHPSHRLLK
jgi:tetrahydromethanopterin S-methyltransferase subunit H